MTTLLRIVDRGLIILYKPIYDYLIVLLKHTERIHPKVFA